MVCPDLLLCRMVCFGLHNPCVSSGNRFEGYAVSVGSDRLFLWALCAGRCLDTGFAFWKTEAEPYACEKQWGCICQNDMDWHWCAVCHHPHMVVSVVSYKGGRLEEQSGGAWTDDTYSRCHAKEGDVGWTMKYILFEIGDFAIHSYGLMIAIGFISCLYLAEKRCPKYGLDPDKIYSLGIWAIVGGMLGAKILYYIVELPAIIADPSLLLDVTNGFVVYGGILGGILAGFLFAKVKKVSFLKYFDITMPSVALAQGFGRIGCFLAGCCYGRETDSVFGVVFHHTPMAPTGVKLIPTQLISSAGDFLMCFLLCMAARKTKKDGQVAWLYLLIYCVGRFLIVFLCYDPSGEVGILSTSQFITLFILLAGIIVLAVIQMTVPDKEALTVEAETVAEDIQ